MRLLVFQHIECEHPGIFRQFLAEDDIQWHAVNLDKGEKIPVLEDYDALWVMGGPMDVWDVQEYPWLVEEKQAIRRWVKQLEKPYLGLCLGHQLLADALGGRCEPMIPAEIGICDIELTKAAEKDQLLGGLPRQQKCLQWHSVQVVQPPENTVILASSNSCPVQAMRIGERAWSLQYHVEIESDTVTNWGQIPAYRQALEKTLGPGALESMRKNADHHLDDLQQTARQLYLGFKLVVSG